MDSLMFRWNVKPHNDDANKNEMESGDDDFGEFEVLQGFLGSAGGQDEPLKFLLRFFKSRPFLPLPVSPSLSYYPIRVFLRAVISFSDK